MTLMLLLGLFTYALLDGTIGESLLFLGVFLVSLLAAQQIVIALRRPKATRVDKSKCWLKWIASAHLAQLLVWSPALSLWPRPIGTDLALQQMLLIECTIGLPSAVLVYLLRNREVSSQEQLN
jgi:hypothetical protein